MKANQMMWAVLAMGLMSMSAGALACGASKPDASGAAPKCFSWADHPRLRSDVERMADGGPWRVSHVKGYPMGGRASAGGELRVDAAAGRFNGRGFCNSFFGAVVGWGAGQVKFGDLGQSKMLCLGDSMRGDQALFAALEEGVKVVWVGSGFVLVDGSGAERVSFERAVKP